MLRFLVISAAALIATVATAGPGSAGVFGADGVTAIWVKIESRPGEGLWQACKRAYNWRDVYQVRGDYQHRPNVVWCYIDHSALHDNNTLAPTSE